jgi:PAS domain S-box-containing protein
MPQEPIQILLVEDSADNAVLLKEEFAESPFGPFSITHVRRLAEALEQVQEREFAAVLLGTGVPGSRGPENPVEIRKHNQPQAPVVVVSGIGGEAVGVRAHRGADDVLLKGALTDRLRAQSVRNAIERKRANQAFVASEQQLALAVDAAGMGIFDWNVQTGKIKWSHHHAALFGVTPEQFGGTDDAFQRCVHPDDWAGIIEKIERCLAGCEEFAHQYRAVWPDASEHWIEGRGRVFRDDRGAAIRMVGTIVDISARKAAEAAARAREAEMAHLTRVVTVGHMASGLGHELSQPLTAIMNYASTCQALIQSHGGLPDGAMTALREVLNEANRAGAIISNMRSFLRKQPPRRVSLDMNELVRGSIGMVEYELRRQRVRPRLVLAVALPKVLGDAVQIEQVLVNILLNALQAMGESGSPGNGLTVNTVLQEHGHSVRVSILDTGPGLSPQNMRRLFEPFFTTRENGLGMGLNICRSIVESHGGRLTAVPNPVRGMCFSFDVPAAG